MNRLALLFLAAVVVMTSMPASITAAAAAPTAISIKTIQLNTSGMRINRSEIPEFAERQAGRILRANADVAYLGEITNDQFLAVRELLAPEGYRVYMTLQNTDLMYGNVLAIKTSASTTKTSVELPTPSYGTNPKVTDVRRMITLSTSIKGLPTLVAGVHFSQVDPDRGDQAAFVLDWLSDRRTVGVAQVLIGDFNLASQRTEYQAFKGLFPDPDMTYPRAGVTAINYQGLGHCIDHALWTGDMTDRATTYLLDSDHALVTGSGTLRAVAAS